MSKIKFDLLSILESLRKIEAYSKDFNDADDFYHDQKSFDASMMQMRFGISYKQSLSL